MTENTESDNFFLKEELSKIESYISYRDKLNVKISKVDVAWHLDHILKTINKIYETLETSNPEAFKPNFNLSRTFVYAYGDFPRGFAKSPRIVLPPDVILTESLYSQIKEAKESIRKIQDLHPKAHFEHPYFSIIDKKQSIRFLTIHTRHHLKIIKDILKNK
ncbi:DinB family protein [Flagellimonas hymeniacidonis]|uniref:DinB family protein n=1 Tax=Flagellimonas hymeniacidonis TaxID=2603628 RepID=A0A5C8V8E6_9FLAO|nr:DinB family protein [Flagellimonas hymeniacidonis]TXN38022.1 DinB family protein [Flagellimonas hymeniacidonis]